MTNYDVIRQILCEHSSRENTLGNTAISRYAKDMGYSIGRKAIEGFMNKMMVKSYETEECDELIKQCFTNMREVYFCKTDSEGRRTKGLGYDTNGGRYCDIELKVNLHSFSFWVLQYSGCVEVLSKEGDDSYRKYIKKTLEKTLEKYKEDGER